MGHARDRLLVEALSFFRPGDEGLTPETKSQIQFCRVLSVVGAVLTLFFGVLFDVSRPVGLAPNTIPFVISGLFVGLLLTSYVVAPLRRRYGTWMQGLLYLVLGWAVLTAALHRFSGHYDIGILLVYAVLTAVSGVGARSLRPVLLFSGFGLAVVAAAVGLGPNPETSPTVVLLSMATVALTESIIIQERLASQEEVREREERLQGLTHSLPGVVFQFYARPDGSYGNEVVGARAEELLGLDPDPDGIFERFVECLPASHRDAFFRSVEEAVENVTEWRLEIPFERPDGERIWLLGTSTPDRQEERVVFNGVLLDITDRKQAEVQSELQTQVLTQVSEGESLQTILAGLVEGLEAGRSDMQGSILLYDQEGNQIQHGAAPGLPTSYNEAIDGTEIGPRAGSCGTAMHTAAPVIAEDIETDPRWENYRAAALQHGLRACWSVPILDAAGAVLGSFAMYYREPKRPSESDWTLIHRARSLAQLAIEHHRDAQRLRLLSEAVDQSTEAVLITEGAPIDEPGPRIVYANTAFEEMTGYAEEDVLGKSPRILQGPETDRDVLDSLRAVLEAGETWWGETVNYRSDGTAYVVRWTVAPVRDDEGKIEYWVSVQRDVTERREVEQRLQTRRQQLEQTRERMELTLEHTNSIVYEIDLDDRSVARHGVFEELFHVKPWDLPTWDAFVEQVVHPDDRDAFRRFYRRLEDGRSMGGELEYRTNPEQGEAQWVRDIVHVREKNGRRTALGLAQDVTDQKERERALRKAKEDAEEAARLKTAMLANMSHEVRTPLTAVIGFSEALAEVLVGENKLFAERIHESSRRLLKTLDSVLALSRLEAGVHEMERELVDLPWVAQETVAMLRPQAEEKGIEVKMDQPDGGVEGQWNEGALCRIAENLLENAIKFTPAGGRVNVCVWERDGRGVLEVEDTGVGIGEDVLPEIFEAFRQESEGVDREYEGTGLGLSIVQELTEALGGTVEVESEKGVGSCFTVRLPK